MTEPTARQVRDRLRELFALRSCIGATLLETVEDALFVVTDEEEVRWSPTARGGSDERKEA